MSKWKCRACGRTWDESQLHSHPKQDKTRTCADLSCGGTCDMLSISEDLTIITKDEGREFIAEVGLTGFRRARWIAWRKDRPNVRGYGMIEQEAIDDLVRNVRPLD